MLYFLPLKNNVLNFLYLQRQSFSSRSASIVVASIFVLTTPWVIHNYNAFISLEPGGLPHNVLGWMIATLLKPVGRETRSIQIYVQDSNKSSWLRYYGPLPQKQRGRPTLSWHSIPHRQLDQFPNIEVAAVRFNLY